MSRNNLPNSNIIATRAYLFLLSFSMLSSTSTSSNYKFESFVSMALAMAMVVVPLYYGVYWRQKRKINISKFVVSYQRRRWFVQVLLRQQRFHIFPAIANAIHRCNGKAAVTTADRFRNGGNDVRFSPLQRRKCDTQRNLYPLSLRLCFL